MTYLNKYFQAINVQNENIIMCDLGLIIIAH